MFPLHPESKPTAKGPKGLIDEGFLAFIPTAWDGSSWSDTLRGVSGGPAIIFSTKGVYLVGVAVEEKKPKNSAVTHVGVIPVAPFLEAFKLILSDQVPEPEISQ